MVAPTQGTSTQGQVLVNQSNISVTANTNILSSPVVAPSFGKITILFITNTAGILSLSIDGILGALNSGNSIPQNTWQEFQLVCYPGMQLNFQFSQNATITLKVIYTSL